jgi:hypothetical protein
MATFLQLANLYIIDRKSFPAMTALRRYPAQGIRQGGALLLDEKHPRRARLRREAGREYLPEGLIDFDPLA